MINYRIVLACVFGGSTSMIVKKMEEVAKEKGINVSIIAVPVNEVSEKVKEADIILLGPHVRHELKRITKIASTLNIPVISIPFELYGEMDGLQILALALKEILDFKNKDNS